MTNLSKTVGLGAARGLRLLTLIALFFIAVSSVNAQTSKAQMDYTRLVGADPADIINTDNTYRVDPNSDEGQKHTFLLMNVGTQEFFNIGGSYGRHATLHDHGTELWIFNKSTTAGTYNIRTRQNYVSTTNPDNNDSYVQYISNDPHKNGVYLDANPTDASVQFGWYFEKADGYSASNKVYKIKTYGDRYLTAVPNDADDNFCQAITSQPQNPDYQVWKLFTLEEYYALFRDSPSDGKNPLDATFLLYNPGLNFDRSSGGNWLITGDQGKAHYIHFGIDNYWRKTTDSYYTNDVGIEQGNTEYLLKNGKYFCGEIKGVQKTGIEQHVSVDRPGYYIIRCNGFSNTNKLAKLFVTDFYSEMLVGYGMLQKPISAETILHKLAPNGSGPTNLLEAGQAFYKGEYDNEVIIHITQEYLDMLKRMEIGNETILKIGVKVEGDDNADASNDWTAFDNFRLLYYGEEAEKPELVLDEENPDLSYLTESSDTYENTTLHLNRSFSLNKWNTLTLPVDLTYGQMKSAFGEGVKLAQLFELSATSIRFKTVEGIGDDEVMLHAFTPYIIKPTQAANAGTAAYTTPRLKKTPNQYWQAKGVGVTNAEDGVTRHISGEVTVKAGHYTIDGVTLDREALRKKLDAHWVSTTTASANNMVCKGTMAKTYYVKDGNGRFYTDNGTQRDDLAGDYFMNKGIMYKVPTTKQYGLKAFRCWFELTSATDAASSTTAPAKDVTLFIDGVNTDVTSIDGITLDTQLSASGVYNLYGQRLRPGTSLEGLPSGIYIVNGKKVKK